MLKEKWNIVEKLPPMLSGEELKRRLEIKPFYDGEIRSKTKSERLVALNEIYSIYLPSVMSEEIYSKIYLAMLVKHVNYLFEGLMVLIMAIKVS